MQVSKLCLAVSGTATLETAYFRTPMVVVYRTNRWARHIAPRLLRVPHFCLVNILAGREAVPEFLKFDDDRPPIAEAALKLLERPRRMDPMPQGPGRSHPFPGPRRRLRPRRESGARLSRNKPLTEKKKRIGFIRIPQIAPGKN